ncbi:Uncharacterised protein [uncultured archaeon]|nr:Uncharacterised protein [uncultured archaeon]
MLGKVLTMSKQSVNVADMLGKTFEALTVQCAIGKDTIECSGEKNPDFNTGMRPDWTVNVDGVVMEDITRSDAHLFKSSPSSIWITPRGGKKLCTLEHGNGIGTVELVCSENPEVVHRNHRSEWAGKPASQDKDLRKRNLQFIGV